MDNERQRPRIEEPREKARRSIVMHPVRLPLKEKAEEAEEEERYYVANENGEKKEKKGIWSCVKPDSDRRIATPLTGMFFELFSLKYQLINRRRSSFLF